MAEKRPGKIPVGDARRISRELGAPVVIIFGLHDSGENFTLTTYGSTKALCRWAAAIGKDIADKILQGTVGPPAVEPIEEVDQPATFEGRKS